MAAHAQIAFGEPTGTGTTLDCLRYAAFSGSQMIKPSGSNQVSTASCPSSANIVRVATDTGILVSVGSSPNALSDAQAQFVPANTVERFFANVGDKVAVALAP